MNLKGVDPYQAYDDPEYQQMAKKSNWDLYYRNRDQFIRVFRKTVPNCSRPIKRHEVCEVEGLSWS